MNCLERIKRMTSAEFKAEILGSPSARDWLKDAVKSADQKDVVDALNDAQSLVTFLEHKAAEISAANKPLYDLYAEAKRNEFELTITDEHAKVLSEIHSLSLAQVKVKLKRFREGMNRTDLAYVIADAVVGEPTHPDYTQVFDFTLESDLAYKLDG